MPQTTPNAISWRNRLTFSSQNSWKTVNFLLENVSRLGGMEIGVQHQLGIPPPGATASDPRERVDRAMTYYRNHSELMKYPEYRKQGLPLTSSHMESTVKMINARVKGSEKFWRKEHGESLLHLRAESLSDSKPLAAFWVNWRNGLTGVNH
jgi:hypothetical protein